MTILLTVLSQLAATTFDVTAMAICSFGMLAVLLTAVVVKALRYGR